jgi:serine/threonine protein kinase
MDGGKIHGKGFKGFVMNVSCKEEQSLCALLDGKEINQLYIYDDSSKVFILRDNKLIHAFINKLYEEKNTVVKNIEDKCVFEQEIKNIRLLLKIYEKSSNLTSFTHVEFDNKNIIGFAIPGKLHFILNKACTNTLKELMSVLNASNANKMIIDLLNSIKIMHKHGVYHVDIKPDNIMKCDDAYKFIDWGNIKTSKELRNSHIRPYGSEFYASPIQWTVAGKETSYGSITRLRFLGKFKFVTGYDITLSQFNNFWDIYIKLFVNPQLNALMRDSVEVLIDKYHQCYSLWAFGISLLILFVIRDYPKKYFDFVETLLNIDHPQFSDKPSKAIKNFNRIILAK